MRHLFLRFKTFSSCLTCKHEVDVHKNAGLTFMVPESTITLHTWASVSWRLPELLMVYWASLRFCSRGICAAILFSASSLLHLSRCVNRCTCDHKLHMFNTFTDPEHAGRAGCSLAAHLSSRPALLN